MSSTADLLRPVWTPRTSTPPERPAPDMRDAERDEVADAANAGWRAALLTELITDMAAAGPDPLDQIRPAARAAYYDTEVDRGDEPSLLDELCAATTGDQYRAVA